MATTIVNVNNTTFSINGVEYLKNFMSIVEGDNVKILNVYDSKVVLQEPTNYADYTVDAAGYASAILLQSALKDVLFNRDNLGSELGYKIINNISDFNALVTGGTAGVWLFLANITLDANKTIPAGVTFEFRNTKIDLNGFTLSGTSTVIDANMQQIFELNGGAIDSTWEANDVQSIWFGVKSDGSTDDLVALQAAIDFVEARVLGRLYLPNGTTLISADIDIENCIVIGRGGHTSKTIIQGTGITGNVVNIIGRSAGITNIRIDASATRRNGMAITDGGLFISIGDVSMGSISRTLINDVYITNQGGFGFYSVANPEFAEWSTVTVEGVLGHPFIFDDGTYAGYTNLDSRPFETHLDRFRALDCGGNILIGNLSQTSLGYQLIFTQLEALDCAWNAAVTVRDEMVVVKTENTLFLSPDFEGQRYAAATDTLGNTVTKTGNPPKGFYIAASGCVILNSYYSSLLQSVLTSTAALKGLIIENLSIFVGNYGIAQANAVETQSNNVSFRFVGDSQTGATNLLKNRCPGADIYLDGVKYTGLTSSLKDLSTDLFPIEATISGGTLEINGLINDVKGQGDTTDTMGVMRIASGLYGVSAMIITLINPNSYTITLTHNGSPTNGQMVMLGAANVVLNQHESIRFFYKKTVTLEAFYEI